MLKPSDLLIGFRHPSRTAPDNKSTGVVLLLLVFLVVFQVTSWSLCSFWSTWFAKLVKKPSRVIWSKLCFFIDLMSVNRYFSTSTPLKSSGTALNLKSSLSNDAWKNKQKNQELVNSFSDENLKRLVEMNQTRPCPIGQFEFCQFLTLRWYQFGRNFRSEVHWRRQTCANNMRLCRHCNLVPLFDPIVISEIFPVIQSGVVELLQKTKEQNTNSSSSTTGTFFISSTIFALFDLGSSNAGDGSSNTGICALGLTTEKKNKVRSCATPWTKNKEKMRKINKVRSCATPWTKKCQKNLKKHQKSWKTFKKKQRLAMNRR